MMRRILCLISSWALLCAAACTERTVGGAEEADDDEGNEGDDAGSRPTTPGVQFAACQSREECTVEYCVFPHEEAGFCAGPCGPGDDPTACGLAPDGHTVPICLDVGAPETVCAIDCADDTCPAGMRCEAIDDGHGGRRVCF